MHTDDVILAVASPPGRSMRGIVRLSGSGVLDILAACVQDHDGHTLARQRGVYCARLTLDQQSCAVLALLMPGPHSYTGEDTAELQLPGNPALLERAVATLLEIAASQGIAARRAEGGEFTARAFFNNKISLTQAEGVAATIAAESDAALRAASMLRSGALGTFAHTLADELAAALALVEAGIDFTDQEDVVAIAPSELHARLTKLAAHMRSQLDRSVAMEQIEAIPWVVLVGRPNAGKSTLFNALLGRERAVVSDVAGTTRDVLAEPMRIDTAHGTAEVILVDLAGAEELDPTGDASALEPQMQQHAQQAMQRAELILMCHAVDAARATMRFDRPTIHVQTKSDDAQTHDASMIAVSAHTGCGLGDLRQAIAAHLADRAVSLAADVFALTPRHEAALRSALQNITEAIEMIEPLRDARSLDAPELVAMAMRAALNDLAALAGDITPDDVLGRVFATFCVGK